MLHNCVWLDCLPSTRVQQSAESPVKAAFLLAPCQSSWDDSSLDLPFVYAPPRNRTRSPIEAPGSSKKHRSTLTQCGSPAFVGISQTHGICRTTAHINHKFLFILYSVSYYCSEGALSARSFASSTSGNGNTCRDTWHRQSGKERERKSGEPRASSFVPSSMWTEPAKCQKVLSRECYLSH